VQKIEVSNVGVVTVYGQGIGSGIDGKFIRMTPYTDAAGSTALTNTDVGAKIGVWKCEGDIDAKYRPASCR
jgi:hypothetical protein